ncbi:uncharacterized protein YbjT (DUF2867 family) [Paenibacillus shirakamiensis]|uniref:Uncharacterized protein YbjT (DUF2867 family) n=1 Tax=Paenibacillus shirakamiensis TaxID=1265935 RepID=A0ABS4JF41_9BACL|nr:NAD(P)H-binding protein [Paenibacillus shirakamiensis]MBP2000331.1 uncharacterized protein YbjT (DUF2867 family) [Paenibacillus shirakamiensis]
MSVHCKIALVAGASGMVGREVVQMLLDQPSYTKVRVLVRAPLGIVHPKLEQIIVSFEQLEQYTAQFQVDEVYCCLGTTIKTAGSQEAFRRVDYDYPKAIAEMASKQHVGKFFVISAVGADPTSKIFYSRVKGEMEQALEGIKFNSLHIFRPSLLLAHRTEFRLGERIASLLSPLYSPLMMGPLSKYKPIRVQDVAGSMVRAAQSSRIGTSIYEGNPLTIV